MDTETETEATAEELDEDVPTRTERAWDMVRRAESIQDRLGWAEPSDHTEVTHATAHLAHVVTELAREVRTLVADVERAQGGDAR